MRGKYHKTQCVIKSKPMSFNICSCFGARKSELSNLSLMVLRLSIPTIKLFANFYKRLVGVLLDEENEKKIFIENLSKQNKIPLYPLE